MRVLINDLVRFRARSGIGSYVEELLHQLPHLLSPLSETWAGRVMASGSQRILNHECADARSSRFKNVLKRYGQPVLNQMIGSSQLFSRWDLYHEPDIITLPLKAPTIVTVPDLSVLINPNWHPEYRVKKYERYLKSAMKRAELFIAISDNTKRDLVKMLGIDDSKVVVTHLAPRSPFLDHPISPRGSYFVFVGTIEPRKNVENLLLAYRSLPLSFRREYPLHLVGHWGWGFERVKDLLESNEIRETVFHHKFLDDARLVHLLQHATAMVYPSLYEGFGLPPLEAMALGTPVITTNEGSLAEVVGDAAHHVDPRDLKSIAQSMARLAEDAGLREELTKRGRERSARFSWRRTALETVGAYERVVGFPWASSYRVAPERLA